ncbi:hypothetical protein WJS89_02645 [Sphingomicrobium sp. XHP0235]|uniref:hypothetical protein n=1 Tax=Sphingomicrobium aquimarinum TaxID=3133971 RepID=UPI0031FEFD17
MVVSIFGESEYDQRDYRMGLAGLLAGTHALRILAERGIASGDDIREAAVGMNEVLDSITTWRPGEKEHLQGLFQKIEAVAEENER